MLLAILGSPSAGNAKFAAILRESVLPKLGGVRIWKDGDLIPWLGLIGYGLKSFSGLAVTLQGQWDPVRTHIQYTTGMPGNRCVNYQLPELFYQYQGAQENLRLAGRAEVP